MYCQLHQHPGASEREAGNLGRMSVPVKTVVSAVREHEEDYLLGS